MGIIHTKTPVTPITKEIVELVKNRIVEEFHPRRIIVFGSYARGAPQAADLDVFVEMESARTPVQRAVEVDAIFGLRTWPMDLLVYTPQEVQQLRGKRGTLLAEIESQGKLIY